MSKQTLGQVVQRAISDAAFRRQLQSDPTTALKGFDLTKEERAALRGGDAGKLTSLGVDQRMSKAYALGGVSAVTRDGGSDVNVDARVGDTGDASGSAIWGDNLTTTRQALVSEETAGGHTMNAEARDGSGGAFTLDASQGGANTSATTTGFEGGPAARVGDVDAKFGSAASGGQIDGAAWRNAAATPGSDSNASTAYVTADEGGRDMAANASAGELQGGPAARLGDVDAKFASAASGGQIDGAAWRNATANAGSDSNASTAYVTADEGGRDMAANASGGEFQGGPAARLGDVDAKFSSAASGGLTADAQNALANEPGGAGGSAFLTADEAGRDAAGRAADTAGWNAAAIEGSPEEAAAALRNDGSAVAREGDAFMTADEASRDFIPGSSSLARNMATDSADIQREALENDSTGGSIDHTGSDPSVTP